MNNYAHSREDRFPLQAKAFKLANDILSDRDGAGFIFHVETHGGHIYSGPTVADEPVEINNEGILSLALGDSVVFIRGSDIAAIRVEEC